MHCSNILHLPNEMIETIINFTTTENRRQLMLCCKYFYNTIDDFIFVLKKNNLELFLLDDDNDNKKYSLTIENNAYSIFDILYDADNNNAICQLSGLFKNYESIINKLKIFRLYLRTSDDLTYPTADHLMYKLNAYVLDHYNTILNKLSNRGITELYLSRNFTVLPESVRSLNIQEFFFITTEPYKLINEYHPINGISYINYENVQNILIVTLDLSFLSDSFGIKLIDFSNCKNLKTFKAFEIFNIGNISIKFPESIKNIVIGNMITTSENVQLNNLFIFANNYKIKETYCSNFCLDCYDIFTGNREKDCNKDYHCKNFMITEYCF